MSALAVMLALSCLGCQPKAQEEVHAPAETQPQATASAAPPAGIRMDLSFVDRKSPAYRRFKNWVDAAAAGDEGYAFAASDAAIMYRLAPKPKYCELAVRMVDKQVADAERAIAANERPDISGDQYLHVGPGIADLSLTLDTCDEHMSAGMRGRWSSYAEQAVWNVWNHEDAKWGGKPFPWSGWAADNPGNNYFYSFVEATMYWALASGSQTWMDVLRKQKLPMLREYYAKLPGGGSLEGTGYGAAHMRLFALYRLWRDATGEDLANASPHATDSIAYWVNATVPSLDRFAPIGDQSRSSVPELFDYHRRIVLEARHLTRDTGSQRIASWWLNNISVDEMQGFNTLYDMLPAGNGGSPPGTLMHHASGTGHLFARSDWTRNAMWLAAVAGPYDESHAHQDQGSFTLFARDWLAVTENIWTHSGIQQGTEVHNVLRFERDQTGSRQCTGDPEDKVIPQCVHAGAPSTMKVSQGPDGAVNVDADLTPAYGRNSAVRSWQRRLEFGARRLRVSDRFSTAPGTRAIFQVNLPERPRIEGNEATAGRLKIRVLEPASASLSALDWRSVDEKEFPSGWRLDVAGGVDRYVVELSEEN